MMHLSLGLGLSCYLGKIHGHGSIAIVLEIIVYPKQPLEILLPKVPFN